MENKTWKKEIQQPWLDWIKSGTKKFEGRIFRDDWAKMKIDDNIIFRCGVESVLTKITSIERYPTFGDAFLVHGKELAPNAVTATDANEIYRNIFSSKDDQLDLKDTNKGPVIVGIKLQ